MKKILGTMTFSDQVSRPVADEMVIVFLNSGGQEMDTAHVYNQGKTEIMLGEMKDSNPGSSFCLASKVHPWNDQGLQPMQITHQLNTSLERLRESTLDLLYLHSPDTTTPIEETLSCCQDLYSQGKFKRLGLSNFSSWQVAEAMEICQRNNWVKPIVYQGMYNAITRDVEPELFPCLRHYQISFYAYNPLAGGLLTGKHTALSMLPNEGRFADNHSYQTRYWKQECFAVVTELSQACRAINITPVDAAYSWLIHHSKLSCEKGDGIILGASRLQQLHENLNAFEQPILDTAILDILDRGWQLIQPNCFKYFR